MKVIVGLIAGILLLGVVAYSLWPKPPIEDDVDVTQPLDDKKRQSDKADPVDKSSNGDGANRKSDPSQSDNASSAKAPPKTAPPVAARRKPVVQHVCPNGASCFGKGLIDDSIPGAVRMQRHVEIGQTCPKCAGPMFTEIWTLPDN